MNPTRRELSLLLPAALLAKAEDKPVAALPSKCYEFTKLAVKTDAKTHNESRQVFDGFTHKGHEIDVHITTLAPGEMPHPAHHHAHEEVIFVKDGTLEVTVKGAASNIGPGSVAYINSNEEHSWKNVGDTPSTYFVLAVGRDKGA